MCCCNNLDTNFDVWFSQIMPREGQRPFKNRDQKYMRFKEIGLCAQYLLLNVGAEVNTIGETYVAFLWLIVHSHFENP